MNPATHPSTPPLAVAGASADPEARIANDVAALKSSITDTRELYREVCALLFFKYRTTPTGSRLYSLVRKGTASLPNEVLASFWEDLRERSRVEIDHPGVPDGIKAVTVAAINDVWTEAVKFAQAALEQSRTESEQAVNRAQTEIDAEREKVHQARLAQAEAESAAANTTQKCEQLHRALERERQDHALTRGRAEELERQVVSLEAQLTQAQASFTSESDAMRAAVEQAISRSESSERRALLHIEQARQAQSTAERTLDTLRAAFATETAALHQASAAHASEAAAAAAQLAEVRASNERLIEQLAAAQHEALTRAKEAAAAGARADTLATILATQPRAQKKRREGGGQPPPSSATPA